MMLYITQRRCACSCAFEYEIVVPLFVCCECNCYQFCRIMVCWKLILSAWHPMCWRPMFRYSLYMSFYNYKHWIHTPPGDCYDPPNEGSADCVANIPRWYFDHNHGDCRPFYYGCDGNGNNFLSYDDCSAYCSQGRLSVSERVGSGWDSKVSYESF